MRKYGVENINNHFMSFNTICDATQVSSYAYFKCSVLMTNIWHDHESEILWQATFHAVLL